MTYLYIFAIFLGSYVLFFVATGLYVLITRSNAAAVYRDYGLSEEKIKERLATQEWKDWSITRRSVVLNGSLFALLVASVYSVSLYML